MSIFTDDRLIEIFDEIMDERSRLLFDKPYQMLSLYQNIGLELGNYQLDRL